ncbi:hypothetical protein C8J56DRAFT_888318 [Mycena floridula]|nr:hypothetical protein C8J56DRAFT_888318 [Mycena floridula]
MVLPATILSADKFCRSKADFPGFKEDFLLALASIGLDRIILGTLSEPTTDPTIVVSETKETRDPSGAITGTMTTTTTRAVTSTDLGADNPTKAAYRVWERKANYYVMTHVVDSKAIGCTTEKTAAENWKIVTDTYGKTSAVEQVMAREKLIGLRLVPVHEAENEYKDHVNSFKAADRESTAAGNKLDDDVKKNIFIESIDHKDYLQAAGSIPATATLDKAISVLQNTWWILYRARSKEIQQAASLVTAMAAQTVATAATSQTHIRTCGNRSVGPCPNPNHGPPGSQSARSHDLAHCWEDGGGDVAGRPPGFRPRNLASQTSAYSAVVPNVQVNSAAVAVPEVFILSAQVPSLADRMEIDVANPGPLIERISDDDINQPTFSANRQFS